MYPGEVRLIQCDGTALRSIVLNSFFATFTTTGTFTKPPGYSYFSGLLWGGGGGGGGSGQTTSGSRAGGGGGACVPFSLPNASVGSSVTVTIGAGGQGGGYYTEYYQGTQSGQEGGTSSFGTIVYAYGGGGGGASTSSIRLGGGGGGALGVGQTDYGSTTVIQGGRPANLVSVLNFHNSGFGGGGSTTAGNGNSAYGGGAGGVSQPGNSIYGGGGGGGSGGTSVFGGSGGGYGNAGTAPAGGGGPWVITYGSTEYNPVGKSGARGELRIWGII
jgi:hypothetical protein